MSLARILMMAGDADFPSATMTAGNYLDIVFGYMSAAQASYSGVSAGFGTVSSGTTAFGLVEGLIYNTYDSTSSLSLTSPSGTPSTIVINGTPYGLTYVGEDGPFQYYSIAGFGGFANGVTYTWSLA